MNAVGPLANGPTKNILFRFAASGLASHVAIRHCRVLRHVMRWHHGGRMAATVLLSCLTWIEIGRRQSAGWTASFGISNFSLAILHGHSLRWRVARCQLRRRGFLSTFGVPDHGAEIDKN